MFSCLEICPVTLTDPARDHEHVRAVDDFIGDFLRALLHGIEHDVLDRLVQYNGCKRQQQKSNAVNDQQKLCL